MLSESVVFTRCVPTREQKHAHEPGCRCSSNFAMKNKAAVVSRFLQPAIRLFIRALLWLPSTVVVAVLKIFRELFSRRVLELIFDDALTRYMTQGYASVAPKHLVIEATIPLQLKLDLGDYIQRSFYLFGYPRFAYELVRFCDEKTTFFDIGANIGLITVAVAQHSNHRNLFAFEPVPLNFAKLQANLSVHCPSAHAVNLALSDAPGEMQLMCVEHDSGSASFEIDYLESRTKAYCSRASRITVPVTTFDDYISNVDLFEAAKLAFKIDVEGHELKVLKGMTAFLRSASQKILIIVEIHKRNYDEVNNLLTANEFRISWPPQVEIETFLAEHSSAIDLAFVRAAKR
jgi:FkbM family methyltransferase